MMSIMVRLVKGAKPLILDGKYSKWNIVQGQELIRIGLFFIQ
jgi:hypothetical protein